MEITLKPYTRNQHPIEGILIKGSLINNWLHEIQQMELNLETISLYPLPDVIPNSVWGCLIVGKIKETSH
ncbi:MAG: hypothetical protein ACK41O_10780, partial [Runella zeae]